MKLVFAFAPLALLPLTVAVNFDWRLYKTGRCNHDAAVDDTYPLNSIGPAQGSNGQCINVPSGEPWDHLEIDTAVTRRGGKGARKFASQNAVPIMETSGGSSCPGGAKMTGNQRRCTVDEHGCTTEPNDEESRPRAPENPRIFKLGAAAERTLKGNATAIRGAVHMQPLNYSVAVPPNEDEYARGSPQTGASAVRQTAPRATALRMAQPTNGDAARGRGAHEPTKLQMERQTTSRAETAAPGMPPATPKRGVNRPLRAARGAFFMVEESRSRRIEKRAARRSMGATK
ncbi:hypothetical protein B0H17DRAFT_1135946 [Mycena rosella]|uniref:Uncharacterized protein n=1 Tax=Mycena rosella TaxID=1033263 RepID=A0AAD7DF04_MYCRO|nr:hypothetical protein B0H17DRAFT_1135946 [Mycena rosella]